MHYFLPGVFTTNPERAVNGSLWTIRPEIFCYLTLAILMIAKLHSNIRFYLGMTAALFCLSLLFDIAEGRGPGFGQSFSSQELYFFHFIVGNLAFHARYLIPYRKSLFAIAACLSGLLLQAPGWEIFAAFPVVYCVIFIGLTPLLTSEVLSKNDYSYGIYLFAYPVQQFVVTFPSTRVWYINILIALPITILLAAASWHFIERPFLSIKRRVQISSDVENRILNSAGMRLAFSLGIFFCYGALLCKWSGLFSWGATMKQDRLQVVFIVLAGTLLATILGRRRRCTLDYPSFIDSRSGPQLTDLYRCAPSGVYLGARKIPLFILVSTAAAVSAK